MQTNFRNSCFKSGSPLPLPHIQKHTLIHHLFKKLSAYPCQLAVRFFFSYASKSSNVHTDIIWVKGEKNFIFANTAPFAQANKVYFCKFVFFPTLSFCTLSDCTSTRLKKSVHKTLNCVGERTAPSTVKSCQCLELIGMDAIKTQNNTELQAHHSQAPESWQPNFPCFPTFPRSSFSPEQHCR